MASTVSKLTDRGLIRPPTWLPDNIQFEGVQGSHAYGVAVDTSDFDVVGWCIPPKDMIFPHLAGEIEGFGRQKKRFTVYQNQEAVHDDSAQGGRGRDYDLSIYNIVHYFHLTMENNPNMLGSLFLPRECVLHITKIGEMVRERRHIFLHKGAWHRFKGYAYQQLSRMSRKPEGGKRVALVEQYGYDVKFAYHLVRLMYEIEQILTTGDLDLRRNSEELKAIRRGEVLEQSIRDFFAAKEKFLEELYQKSNLPWGPREDEIKRLLLDCLEEHYGNLSDCVVTEADPIRALREIADIINENRHLLR